MNLLNTRNLQILAVIILAVSIKMYIDHRKKGYLGPYNPAGAYDNITAVKHDMTKALSVDLFVMLVLGMATGQQFYNPDNMLDSWLGKALVTVAAFFVYHEFVQPYIVNALPNF
jgi:hypothetical protein